MRRQLFEPEIVQVQQILILVKIKSHGLSTHQGHHRG